MCIIMVQGNMPKIASLPRDCRMNKRFWRVYRMDVLDLRVLEMNVASLRLIAIKWSLLCLLR